eukprot:TRINITY_DN11369_c0_g1_i1.p1 TRINITY_DN11369_c0_g1~~TRINITY_DN11369_c0_g1_i1.p1  ORF type:complete len:282 (+),score=42.72 TRINITY_DN11369_c0_g1_i1:92-937(+)
MRSSIGRLRVPPQLKRMSVLSSCFPKNSEPLPSCFGRTFVTSCISSEQKCYPAHVPTTIAQKAFLTMGSSVMALLQPTRADMVAILGEVTGAPALERMYHLMQQDPVGREILAKKPVISEASLGGLERLRALPPDTFGYAYVQFLDRYGLSPDERATVRFVDDSELAYVMLRYRQVHDFWHVLSGLPQVDVLSEIAVKWLEMVQTGLPLTALSALVGPLSLSFWERELLRTKYVPWALRCGRNSVNLLNVAYEQHFDDKLHDFRRLLRFEPFSSNPPDDSH